MSTQTNYQMVKLGDILTYLDERIELDDFTEYITITVKRRHGGLVERERLSGHQIKTKKQFRLIPGSFIISRVQCWHQAFAIVPDDVPPNMIASINYDQFKISPDVDPRYFWWFSHSPYFTETVRSSAIGVVIEKVVFKRDQWLEKEIPLPPLSEQRRIVARLEALAAKVEMARGLQQQAAKGAEVLSGSGAVKAFRALDGANTLPIKKIAEVRGGLQKSPKRIPLNYPVRYLTVAHVQRNSILLSDPRYFEMPPDELEQRRLRSGDVLIIEGNGSADQIGRTAVFRGEIEPCVHQNHVICIRPDQDKIDSEYLNVFLNSPVGRDKVKSQSRTTSGLLSLSMGRIKEIHIPVPSLSEQRRIVAYLDDLQAKVDSLKDLQAETAAELDALLPSILDKAFKGKL